MTSTVRKLLQLHGPEEHARLAGIVLIMVITGLLETVGIASVMPFLAVVANPAAISENAYLSWGYSALGVQSTDQFIFALGALFVVVMVGSNLFSTFATWTTIRFQWRVHEDLSNRLMRKYLDAPYGYHLANNSSRLASTLLAQVGKVTSGVLLPGIRILARVFSSAFIIALLVAVDPLLALLVSVTIGGFYAGVYALVRRGQQRLGMEEVAAKNDRFQVAGEALGGIKEIKVLGREEHFRARYREPSARFARVNALNAMVGLMPRFALETIAYGGIVVVTIYLLRSSSGLDEVVPLLAVYAFGANRLIPGVQEIFHSLATIRFRAPVVDELHADLFGSADATERVDPGPGREREEANSHPPAPLLLEAAIRFRDVSFAYPESDGPAITHVTLDIPARGTTAFVGPTGAGKTTLVDLILGLFEATEGTILADDVVLDESSLPAWRRSVGYVPQAIYLSDASIAENIAFGLPEESIDHTAVLAAAHAANLDGFVSTLPRGYDTVVGERGVRLSGGQRQRIGIARALYHNPSVLVLDEATSALDNVTEDVVMQAIEELGGERTIILIAHRLSTVRDCDVIYLIEGGHVVAKGNYEDLVRSSSTFRALARV